MPRGFEFVSISRRRKRFKLTSVVALPNWLVRIMALPFLVSKKYREGMRQIRFLDKAHKAQRNGDAATAERLWRDELARTETASDQREKIKVLSLLGSFLLSEKRYQEAEKYFREALELARTIEGPAGFWALGQLDHLGWAYNEQGREAEAEACFLEALHTAEKELGPTNQRVEFELLGLANFYEAHGNTAGAIAVTERIVALRGKGTEISEVTFPHSLLRLANLYSKVGREDEAEALYRRCIELFQNQKGRQLKRLTQGPLYSALECCTALLRKQGRVEEASFYNSELTQLKKKLFREWPL